MSLNRERLAALQELQESWDLPARVEPYMPLQWRGEQGRTLHLDDVSGIPFLDGVPGMEEYQHRARVRCHDGDLFAAVTVPAPGYERYCREVLTMGCPSFVLAEPAGSVIEVAAACTQGQAYQQLNDALRETGQLIIHPYMGIEAVWSLAQRLYAETGLAVPVIAPPPPVTWVANDKSRLNALVEAVLGPAYRIAGLESRDFAQIAKALGDMAHQHRRVGLKRSRCASAMGNRVYDAAEILACSALERVALVRDFARQKAWDGQEDLLVCGWLEACASPSTQLWIPPEGLGAPRVDGVYQQLLEGSEGIFLGSRPSDLPAPVNEALRSASLVLASALQFLGYVGRCSFDFLVLGDPSGTFDIRVSECNGRWGGTSTPMALVDRLLPAPRPNYRAQDVLYEQLVGRSFDSICAALEEDLYRPDTGHGRYILYNVGPLARSGKLDVIALAPSPEQADEALLHALPDRLGLNRAETP